MNTNPSERSGSRLVWLLPAALVLAIILLITAGALSEKEAPPAKLKRVANVEVLTVNPTPYDEVLVLPARIEARASARIAPEMGGRISRWTVKEGARVTRGEPLGGVVSPA